MGASPCALSAALYVNSVIFDAPTVASVMPRMLYVRYMRLIAPCIAVVPTSGSEKSARSAVVTSERSPAAASGPLARSSALTSEIISSIGCSAFIRPNCAATRASSLYVLPGSCDMVTTTSRSGGSSRSGATPKRSGKPASCRRRVMQSDVRAGSAWCASATLKTDERSAELALTSAAIAWSVEAASTNDDSTDMKREKRPHTTESACSRRPPSYLASTAVTGATTARMSACFDSYCAPMNSSIIDVMLATMLATSDESWPATWSASAAAYAVCSLASSSAGSLLPRAAAASTTSSMSSLYEESASSIFCTSGSDSIG
mmetsp:Transcript_63936/g.170538  ORF Transcript_63936/g.170538 Transcript_63936/m.170538 type:complete len:318 (-) Transcript_63936:2553-3506(-)